MFNPMFNELFGKLVVDRRRAKGITQAKLASKLGVSAQFLGRCEKGRIPFPQKYVRKMLRPLRIDIDEVAGLASDCAEEYAYETFS